VKWAGCWFGPHAKEKKTSWAGLARELGEAQLFCFLKFLFFYFFLKLLLKTFSKILNKLLTTQSIKTHAFNMMHKHLVSLN
jgi:hypothetical protein